ATSASDRRFFVAATEWIFKGQGNVRRYDVAQPGGISGGGDESRRRCARSWWARGWWARGWWARGRWARGGRLRSGTAASGPLRIPPSPQRLARATRDVAFAAPKRRRRVRRGRLAVAAHAGRGQI